MIQASRFPRTITNYCGKQRVRFEVEGDFNVASVDKSLPYAGRVKRVVDMLAALGGLLIAAPILAVAALLVKLDSSGPAFYSQERLGRGGIPFRILKLRTMTADAESRTGPVWAAENDPRITRVGRWLRKCRIDELPQLINVLRGEMSIVGPRPEREFFIRQLAEQIPHYSQRLMVRPGITGWAQVTQPYAASIVESRDKLQADLYYLRHMSVLVDIQIILKTAKVVVLGHER